MCEAFWTTKKIKTPVLISVILERGSSTFTLTVQKQF